MNLPTGKRSIVKCPSGWFDCFIRLFKSKADEFSILADRLRRCFKVVMERFLAANVGSAYYLSECHVQHDKRHTRDHSESLKEIRGITGCTGRVYLFNPESR